ncbi:EamA-like transporter family protein [Octadecabacter temperatus]|uniref:EamA-like transporter family protein n=1 Tax=Octadecabacter temperatus TaxID=1458307 RepID=A0A0K0Y9L6_9RHOB|nr:DMT family transporter [Octadecabacter temperatus]AKS47567.1 EamA-like transporter family protein [Octadecabacter temperatus]SIO41177.1 EamA-like transporter family protein [Octadecabacter temperatus]
MPTIVIGTTLLAALLHACWNALAKGAADKHLSMAGVIIGHLPFAIIGLLFVPMPDLACWPYLLGSLVLHFGYQVFLLNSYRIGDLTQVYPVARGIAPLIVAMVSVSFLNVILGWQEVLAIVLIGTGLLSLGLVRGHGGARNPKAAMLAAVTGCFIAGYSLVDGLGARVAGTGVGFYGWSAICNAVIFATFMRVTKPGTLSRLWTEGRFVLIVGGCASYCAYALVVWGFMQAPIALVTALRETSIIFALFIGVFFMGERLDLFKVGSTFLTLIGAVLLRFAR